MPWCGDGGGGAECVLSCCSKNLVSSLTYPPRCSRDEGCLLWKSRRQDCSIRCTWSYQKAICPIARRRRWTSSHRVRQAYQPSPTTQQNSLWWFCKETKEKNDIRISKLTEISLVRSSGDDSEEEKSCAEKIHEIFLLPQLSSLSGPISCVAHALWQACVVVVSPPTETRTWVNLGEHVWVGLTRHTHTYIFDIKLKFLLFSSFPTSTFYSVVRPISLMHFPVRPR